MRKILFSVFIYVSTTSVYSQIFENGIGGYGYLEYDIMHNPKSQTNWIYGGGGLLVNKVFSAGLYYGAMINNYNSLPFGDAQLRSFSSHWADNTISTVTNINCSDLGVQIGGIIWAEKPLQISFSIRSGVFLSNYTEWINYRDNTNLYINSTKPFFTAMPDMKLSFMPNKLMKFQTGFGYKYVYYDNSLLKETIFNGNRKTLFDSFFWNFAIIFGSF